MWLQRSALSFSALALLSLGAGVALDANVARWKRDIQIGALVTSQRDMSPLMLTSHATSQTPLAPPKVPQSDAAAQE